MCFEIPGGSSSQQDYLDGSTEAVFNKAPLKSRGRGGRFGTAFSDILNDDLINKVISPSQMTLMAYFVQIHPTSNVLGS